MNEAIKVLEQEVKNLKKNSDSLPMEQAMQGAEKLHQIERAIAYLSAYAPSCNSREDCFSCGS